MSRFAACVVLAAAVAVSGCAGLRAITEADVLQYASKPYDKGSHGPPHQVLGSLNDVAVVVDFLCSDLCPMNTVRIIHFDVDSGERCADAGGIERTVIVPVAITSREKSFCFPEVLAQNWSTYIR